MTGAYAAPQWLNALLLSAKNAILFVGLDRNVDVQVAWLYGAAHAGMERVHLHGSKCVLITHLPQLPPVWDKLR